jgi:hypothetical protein
MLYGSSLLYTDHQSHIAYKRIDGATRTLKLYDLVLTSLVFSIEQTTGRDNELMPGGTKYIKLRAQP